MWACIATFAQSWEALLWFGTSTKFSGADGFNGFPMGWFWYICRSMKTIKIKQIVGKYIIDPLGFVEFVYWVCIWQKPASPQKKSLNRMKSFEGKQLLVIWRQHGPIRIWGSSWRRIRINWHQCWKCFCLVLLVWFVVLVFSSCKVIKTAVPPEMQPVWSIRSIVWNVNVFTVNLTLNYVFVKYIHSYYWRIPTHSYKFDL